MELRIHGAAIGAVFLVTSCSSPVQRDKPLLLVSDAEISAMGTKAFTDLKAKSVPSSDLGFSTRVSCVSAKLLASIKAAPSQTNWEVITVKGREANISSLPGGKIAVNDGVARVASTPDEVAAALSTAISQITLRQANQRISRQMALALGVQIAGKDAGPIGLDSGFNVEDAIAADSEGRKLMADAGFDPAASVTLLRKMLSDSPALMPSGLEQRLAAAESDAPAPSLRRQATTPSGNLSCT